MQILVQVVCSEGTSLRAALNAKLRDTELNRKRINEYGIVVEEESRKERNPGWSKLKAGRSDIYRDVNGVVNIEWIASSNVLMCRTIGKGDVPSALIARLIRYLMENHAKRIEAINILPRNGRGPSSRGKRRSSTTA